MSKDLVYLSMQDLTDTELRNVLDQLLARLDLVPQRETTMDYSVIKLVEVDPDNRPLTKEQLARMKPVQTK